jgi:hypothetical protein
MPENSIEKPSFFRQAVAVVMWCFVYGTAVGAMCGAFVGAYQLVVRLFAKI